MVKNLVETDSYLSRNPLLPDEAECLSGADSIALILHHSGIETVFAYPGTSELSLCDAVKKVKGLTLINGRGDKESAFMAAGGCLIDPSKSVAILHGARGLTNATGAIADAYRNEVGMLVVVGLPSTSSARFLPPHGEKNLMSGVGNFVKWWYELDVFPNDKTNQHKLAFDFVKNFKKAIELSRKAPYGPIMFGIPQNMSESLWVPKYALDDMRLNVNKEFTIPNAPEILELFRQAKKPVILVDDYLLHYKNIRLLLDRFSENINAPVFQVQYRRGPMLFERLNSSDCNNFVGWYDPSHTEHAKLMEKCDFLILLEDRNMYSRVIGDLPNCRKISVTSNSGKSRKNEHLADSDFLLEGDVSIIINKLNLLLDTKNSSGPWWMKTVRVEPLLPKKVAELRSIIVGGIAESMSLTESPILIDDSQMFGGMLATLYDFFPNDLRVFGSHGGFVGAGISYATGLALSDPTVNVFCSLGDQAFTNAIQGLVSAAQENANVCYMVCNNGGSVSLKGQSKAGGAHEFSEDRFLANVPDVSYTEIATSLGVNSDKVEFSLEMSDEDLKMASGKFEKLLTKSRQCDGPFLIEIVLPSAPEFWEGVWLMKGFDGK